MLDSFDLYSYTDYWRNESNILGTDFNLYSTFEDAIQDTNAWTYCNYDAPDVGMFRDCGPDGAVGAQWTHRTWAWQPASFYLLAGVCSFCRSCRVVLPFSCLVGSVSTPQDFIVSD